MSSDTRIAGGSPKPMPLGSSTQFKKLILVDPSWGGDASLAHTENEHNEIMNKQYPETWEKVLSAHERGFHRCSK